jgi:predicted RNA-binding protein
MKSILVSIVAAVLLVGCGKSQDTDLNGKWLGKGYKCWGNLDENGEILILDEEISISQDGDKVVATKITGDECVKAGEKTWEGKISGDWIEGVSYGRLPSSSKLESFKARIEIKSSNLLYLEASGVEFVRILEAQ